MAKGIKPLPGFVPSGQSIPSSNNPQIDNLSTADLGKDFVPASDPSIVGKTNVTQQKAHND